VRVCCCCGCRWRRLPSQHAQDFCPLWPTSITSASSLPLLPIGKRKLLWEPDALGSYSRVCIEEAIKYGRSRTTFGHRLMDHQASVPFRCLSYRLVAGSAAQDCGDGHAGGVLPCHARADLLPVDTRCQHKRPRGPNSAGEGMAFCSSVHFHDSVPLSRGHDRCKPPRTRSSVRARHRRSLAGIPSSAAASLTRFQARVCASLTCRHRSSASIVRHAFLPLEAAPRRS
jgi:hypothetical protein